MSDLVQSFADRISSTWKTATNSIIETGRLLVEAETNMSELEYMELIGQLPFSQSTASKLMVIGQTPHLQEVSESLPPHWTTIYELAQLDEQSLLTGIEDGWISPSTERDEVIQYKNRDSSQNEPVSIDDKTPPTFSKKSRPSVFGRILVSDNFDLDRIDELEEELNQLCDKYSVEYEPDGSKSGPTKFKRDRLAKETTDWLVKREKTYNSAKLAPRELQILEDSFAQINGELLYHPDESGKLDPADINHPDHPHHGWTRKNLYDYCREHRIVTRWSPIKDIDKTANVRQLLLQHSTGNSRDRYDAKIKLERLAKRGNDESQREATVALSQLIES